jgi:rsbT antagonist protein RsbS
MRNPELPSAPQPPLVSILRQGGYLIASIHTALDDTQLQRFQRDLIEQVGRYRARGIIIDVAALDVVDSFATHTLRTLAHVANLRGAVTVIVGINPEVAFTMVRLGMNLDPVHTALDLDEGLALLDSLARGRREQPTDRSLLRHRPVL